jgi:histone deacetylase complex regulatory component SIN3
MALAEDLKLSDAVDETFMNLKALISARENSRRTNNNLMKPLSEIDLAQFNAADHVTPSYYKLSADFPNPICSGRFKADDNLACQTLNDYYCSITTGSENFKLKQKQEYEDNLFKNEDAMYFVDH